MADIRHIKCKKINGKVAKSPKFFTLTGTWGRRIERRCLDLHRKFINNRFSACAVQILLKMAVNETICSTFEVQYCKSTSPRTTAIRHLVPPLTDNVISRMRRNSYVFNTGLCIIFAHNFNYFHRRATEVATRGSRDSTHAQWPRTHFQW